MIFLNPCELTASVTAVANAMACGMEDGELTLMAAIFTMLGDTLATIAAARSACGNAKE